MLTPKERDNLAELQEQMGEIERVLHGLNRHVEGVLDRLEHTATGQERFEQPEVARLMTLNRRLTELEQHLRDQALVLEPALRAKLADPTSRMYDYEIDAEIAYVLREGDEEAVEDDDNILTRREEMLKDMANTRMLADGTDHRESIRSDMAQLGAEPHCWLFHDLYDHSYGFSKAERPTGRLPAHWHDLGGCRDPPAVLLRHRYRRVGPTLDGRERGKEGVKARPRIQREFLHWLSENRQRFAVPGPHHQTDGSVGRNGFCGR